MSFFADLSKFMNSDYFADVSKSKTLKSHTLKKMMTIPVISLIDDKID